MEQRTLVAIGQTSFLPQRVLDLASREQELATLVYEGGPMTAKDMQSRLSSPLTNAAVRSMLTRLCNKGILKRRKRVLDGSYGRRIAFLYFPALTSEVLRTGAIRQLAIDYFDGSLPLLAKAAAELAVHGKNGVANSDRRRAAG